MMRNLSLAVDCKKHVETEYLHVLFHWSEREDLNLQSPTHRALPVSAAALISGIVHQAQIESIAVTVYSQKPGEASH